MLVMKKSCFAAGVTPQVGKFTHKTRVWSSKDRTSLKT